MPTETTNSRDAILQSVRNAVTKGPHVVAPPVPEVWPRANSTPAVMAERFAKELADVHGEIIRCATMAEARQKLADLAAGSNWTSLAVMERPLVGEATAGLPEGLVQHVSDWQAVQISEVSASVIEADVLLADTGTAMIVCETAQDRLLCYLPPACVVVARTDRLAEHLPAAWATIAPRVAEPDRRGEFVFITGPSRTADIEKILILGVHGPKRLVVILVD